MCHVLVHPLTCTKPNLSHLGCRPSMDVYLEFCYTMTLAVAGFLGMLPRMHLVLWLQKAAHSCL